MNAPPERNPLIEEFYASLSPSERTAHEIAAKPGSDGGLGSSYIVTKTHSFVKWLKKRVPVPHENHPKKDS
jgi:hypothetical protein